MMGNYSHFMQILEYIAFFLASSVQIKDTEARSSRGCCWRSDEEPQITNGDPHLFEYSFQEQISKNFSRYGLLQCSSKCLSKPQCHLRYLYLHASTLTPDIKEIYSTKHTSEKGAFNVFVLCCLNLFRIFLELT
jgi:hypothetical protein